MTFQTYPDPAAAPVVVVPGATSPPVSVVELMSPPAGGLSEMFVTVACTPPVLGPVAGVLAPPTVALSADGAPAVPVTSVGGVDPTEVVTGQVYATVHAEGDGVYRVELYKFSVPAISWAVELTNNEPGGGSDAWFTWVVADAEAEARQPWLEVDPVLDWDTLGTVFTGQHVPYAAPVGNRGTGPLTLGLATGVVGTSSFEVMGVPGPIQPGTTAPLDLTFHAPPNPGQESGVSLDLASDDPEAANAAPAHPTSPELSGSRGRLEVMLLLDASGSMGYQPDGTTTVSASDARWAKLAAAAEQFLDLLGDFSDGLGRFGVSVFPDITDPAFPPQAPSPSAAHLHPPEDISPAAISTAVAALAVPNPPQPSGGATPMGFGIGHTIGDTAGSFGDFDSSPEAVAHNRRILVLMSDGAHNSGDHPSIYWRTAEGDGCPDAGTAAVGRSFVDKAVAAITVAYGDPEVTAFQVDHDLLSLVACKSGGAALDALADDAGLDLLKGFRDALIDGLALDPSIDPGGVLTAASPSVRRGVQVLEADQQVSFVVDWVSAGRGRLRVDLLTPLCELVSSSDPPRGILVHEAARFLVVTVTEDYLRNAEDPTRPRDGQWTLIITADDLGDGSERYQYSVLTRSRLRLQLTAGSARHVAGDTIGLVADLRLDGRPVPDASVTVHYDRPGQAAMNWLAALPVTADELQAASADLGDPEAGAIGTKAHALHRRGERFDPLGQSAALRMTPSPDGAHRLTLPDSSIPGTYTFRAVATGELDGIPFRREQRVQVRVGVLPDPAFTLVDIAYVLVNDVLRAQVRVWPRDRFGNVVMIDPAIDPSLDIRVGGAKPLAGVQTNHDGSYSRLVDLAPGAGVSVTVTMGGQVVLADEAVPPPSGLRYADRLVDHVPGAEAAPGANSHTDPEALLGEPGTPPRDFLALGAGGQVTVAVGEQYVLARGGDDVNVIVAGGSPLRAYTVQAQQPVTGRWVDLGRSEGTSASFGLASADLIWTPAVRVVDASGRTREADLSVSTAPGAQVAGIGFRAVGEQPSGCFGVPMKLKYLVGWLLRGLRSASGPRG